MRIKKTMVITVWDDHIEWSKWVGRPGLQKQIDEGREEGPDGLALFDALSGEAERDGYVVEAEYFAGADCTHTPQGWIRGD